jgi:uncharacterized protein HemX
MRMAAAAAATRRKQATSQATSNEHGQMIAMIAIAIALSLCAGGCFAVILTQMMEKCMTESLNNPQRRRPVTSLTRIEGPG